MSKLEVRNNNSEIIRFDVDGSSEKLAKTSEKLKNQKLPKS